MTHILDALTFATERARSIPVAAHRPGLALCAAIGGAALAIHKFSGVVALSPMLLAIGLAVAVNTTIGTPPRAVPGIAVALKRFLRLGIILLGLQITAGQILSMGPVALAIVSVALAATFPAMLLVGRLLGVERPLTQLIAAGTSVCGASAVIAANTVARGSDEDVAYAVASVTLFGTLSMLAFPALGAALGLDPVAYGVWIGATVHEVAQVAATAFAMGDEAGQYGTVAKLWRVVLLAPLIAILAASARFGRISRARGSIGAGVPVPWFVVGFVALIALNSAVSIPSAALEVAEFSATLFLAMALAAMGLQIDLRALRRRGVRPFVLAAFGWLFISTLGLAMVSASWV